MGNLGKQAGTMDTGITNRIQDMRKRILKRILVVEDTVEEIDTLVKENVKSKRKKNHYTKHSPNPGHTKSPNITVEGVKERADFQLRRTENIFNKTLEETVSNLKKNMPIKVL